MRKVMIVSMAALLMSGCVNIPSGGGINPTPGIVPTPIKALIIQPKSPISGNIAVMVKGDAYSNADQLRQAATQELMDKHYTVVSSEGDADYVKLMHKMLSSPEYNMEDRLKLGELSGAKNVVVVEPHSGPASQSMLINMGKAAAGIALGGLLGVPVANTDTGPKVQANDLGIKIINLETGAVIWTYKASQGGLLNDALREFASLGTGVDINSQYEKLIKLILGALPEMKVEASGSLKASLTAPDSNVGAETSKVDEKPCKKRHRRSCKS